MKKIFKPLIKILIFIIVFNFFMQDCSFGMMFEDDDTTIDELQNVYDEDAYDALADEGKATIENSENTEVELLGNNSHQSFLVITVLGIINVIPITLHVLISSVSRDGQSSGMFTIQDLVLGKLDLFDVNIFNSNTSSKANNALKREVTRWYYTLRNIAIIISLGVLIFIAIRMALSTIASEKAKYKTMLFDWVVSFLIIFAITYILAITFNIYEIAMSRTTECCSK